MTRPLPTPRTRSVLLLLLGAALLTAACDEATVRTADVTVMTRNIYLGANIFRITQAQTAQDIPEITAEIFAIMESNDFRERAGGLAAEIQATDPHLVGLQEVVMYRTQDPSDYVEGVTTPNAADLHTDFLQVLMDSLAALGLDYTIASQVVNADVELPAAKTDSTFFDVRMTDRDVILARADVGTANPGGDGFDVIVPFELVTGDTVWFERGYTWVDATVDDVDFTFVNTHLEISAGGQLVIFQTAQVKELVERFGGSTPVVAVGDFNTKPGEQPYINLTQAFTDAWPLLGGADSLTCCQNEVLTTTRELYSRIDLIVHAGAVAPLSGEVVGNELADRTASGLWPSDHAGVVTTLRIEN